ncbi:hypothetical protein J6590_053211 [Homalodisca vitripennis]|nr:hypothetical protein J6590_053211 [Homalodisca vitripennis]
MPLAISASFGGSALLAKKEKYPLRQYPNVSSAHEQLELQHFTTQMVASDIVLVVKFKVMANWNVEWWTWNLYEKVALCRLRLSHTLLAHLSYLMSRDISLVCTICDTVVTVVHVLVDCPHYP